MAASSTGECPEIESPVAAESEHDVFSGEADENQKQNRKTKPYMYVEKLSQIDLDLIFRIFT